MSGETEAIVQAVGRSILESSDTLNALDGQAGDGDLGLTAAKIAQAMTEASGSIAGLDMSALLGALGSVIGREAPSTSGTLLALGLAAANQATVDAPDSAMLCARALEACAAAIADAGGATPGAKTMLDALVPAAEAAMNSVAERGNVLAVLRAAAEAAEGGARATAQMVPKFGRASWLSERSQGGEDGGARLIAIVLEALYLALRRSQVSEPGD